jgi:flagellar protein FlgJ
MLKSARDASNGDGLFDSEATQTYREMLDQQLAQQLAQRNDFGIGRGLMRQFAELLGDTESAASERERAARTGGEAPPPAVAELRRYHGPARESRTRVSAIGSATRASQGIDARRQFVAELATHAETAAAELGVSPRAILAQAGLESGWGRHVIRDRDGHSSHNYFGIKAGPGWHGDTVRVPTTEYVGGRAVTVQAKFRAYPSAADAFRDYVDFIGANPRYADALARGHSEAAYARELAAAGYATDPRYAEKIIAIIETGDWGDLPRTTPARDQGS